MRAGSRAETFSETDFERYRRAWDEEGAVTGMLNWYRALFRHSDDPPREQVEVPTLIIWGENDQVLVPEMPPKSVDYCKKGVSSRPISRRDRGSDSPETGCLDRTLS